MDIIECIKKDILNISFKTKNFHIPSSFSILDILYILYYYILNINLYNLKDNNRDVFILSKGHAAIALYLILAKRGFISDLIFDNICKYNSILGGHPHINIPGVEVSTGSLGHGLPYAVGFSIGKNIQNNKGMVYCLIGDGEANEGTTWESALLASHYKLNNLHYIIDHNHSTDRALNVDSLAEKFSSFGWDADLICGHNHIDIYNSLVRKSNKPMVTVCETIKGYGCKTLENNPEWHHKSPCSKEELDFLIKQIEEHEKHIIYPKIVGVIK
jgi:transketolase